VIRSPFTSPAFATVVRGIARIRAGEHHSLTGVTQLRDRVSAAGFSRFFRRTGRTPLPNGTPRGVRLRVADQQVSQAVAIVVVEQGPPPPIDEPRLSPVSPMIISPLSAPDRPDRAAASRADSCPRAPAAGVDHVHGAAPGIRAGAADREVLHAVVIDVAQAHHGLADPIAGRGPDDVERPRHHVHARVQRWQRIRQPPV